MNETSDRYKIILHNIRAIINTETTAPVEMIRYILLIIDILKVPNIRNDFKNK